MPSKNIPIETLHLFPVLNKMLVELLNSLSPEDWNKPTLAPLWTVKDIAAHLLDTNIRAISSGNNYSGKQSKNINSYANLVNYLNELNAVWVKAMDRVSPQQLIEMLETTGEKYCAYLKSLDPFAPAKYSVLWAGEQQSKNWFHIAREYTEKWHHQQQIHAAVDKPGLMTRELFYPCIDTFMRGLPQTYLNVAATSGTVVEINISTAIGGTWYLVKEETFWRLFKGAVTKRAEASITIDPQIAWKLFTKGIKPEIAQEQSLREGNEILSGRIFKMISIMG